MTLEELIKKREALKAKWHALEKEQRDIEQKSSEVNIEIAKLCKDHKWQWNIKHRRVDVCSVCRKTRLIENRPDDYKLTLNKR